jgi:hypothetical protein
MHAASIVSQQAKRHGGPHKLRWTGCKIGPDTTVEYRVRIGGTSLEEVGQPVADNVQLLPIPSMDQYVEVYVILGPKGPKQDYPRASDGETHLLGEGRLSNDHQVWVVYSIQPNKENEKTTSPAEPIRIDSFESSYSNPDANLNGAMLRGVAFDAQDDGSLLFLDLKATMHSAT